MLNFIVWAGVAVVLAGVIAIGVAVYVLATRRENAYRAHLREVEAGRLRVRQRLDDARPQ
jgi:hypothetical protein